MKVYEGSQRTTIEMDITKDLDKIISALKLKAYDALTPPDYREFYLALIEQIKLSKVTKNLNLLFT